SAPQHLEAAVSAVLGDRLEGVVVEGPAVAARGVDLLKRMQEGRTTFLPRQVRTSEATSRTQAEHAPGTSLGWSRDPTAAPVGAIEVVALSDRAGGAGPSTTTPSWLERPGVLGRLAALVDVGGELAATARELIGDTVVVEELARALGLCAQGDARCPLVTLGGDRLEPSGVVVGGSPTALDSALLQQKREIRELEEIVAQLEQGFEVTRGRHLALAERQAEVERAREQSEADVLEAEKAKLGRSQALAQLRADLQRLEADLRRRPAERDQPRAQAEARVEEIEQLRAQVAADEAEVETQAAAVEQASVEHDERVGAREQLGTELTEARVALARWQQQADALAATRDRLGRQAASERERIARLRGTA